jgi:DNA-directed RNA polymerase alpha subunit
MEKIQEKIQEMERLFENIQALSVEIQELFHIERTKLHPEECCCDRCRTHKILLKNIEKYDLSVRLSNALKCTDINCLADLFIEYKSEDDFKKFFPRIRNVGRGTMRELEDLIKKVQSVNMLWNDIQFGIDVTKYGVQIVKKEYGDKYKYFNERANGVIN